MTTTRHELISQLERLRPEVVLIEVCALSGWVHDLCVEQGVRCVVANTASEAWKFKHTKRKTDRDDARRLVELYLLDRLPEVAVPPKGTREWRSLIAHRQHLVGLRVRAQNRIRAILVGQGLPAPRGAWAMLRYNPWARAVYARLSHGGKTRRKQAIVALARKLLVRCWAMLRDQTPWQGPSVVEVEVTESVESAESEPARQPQTRTVGSE